MAREPSKPWPTVRRFIRDWVLFAPSALLIGLVVSWLRGVDLVSAQVGSGALITFGLSFFLAFFDDLPTDEWEEKSGWFWGSLSVALSILYWVVIGLALVGITVVFVGEADGTKSSPTLNWFMIAFGSATVVIALLVGIAGTATQIRLRRS